MLDSTAFVTADQGLVGRPTAVSYTRVSSKDQERGGFSIPAQRKLLLRYAAERGLHIAAEFSDVETAGKTGRTGFDAMVRYVRNHATCTVILVEKTDRLYRNLKDWVTLDELGVTVHLVKVFCPADLSQLCPSEISREMSWDGADFSVPSHTLFPG